MRIAFQMDHPAGLNTATDSSLALMEEAIARGAECYYYAPQALSLNNGKVIARAQRMHLQLGKTPYYTLDDEITLALDTCDAVLVRQDPPFNMHYITATYLLERLPATTRVLNNPTTLRNAPEKLSVTEFSDFTPPTLISENAHVVQAFVKAQGKVVAKPLYGFGGHSVFVFEAGDPNLDTFLEHWHTSHNGALVWQAFLPDVAKQECRILFINGVVAAAFTRIPAEGSIRSNMRVGGTPVPHTLTDAQRACCDVVGPWLKTHGVMLAGVDMIGGHLIEINITSPTGLRAAQQLYGHNLAAMFWDGLRA